jgi:hypothetical protein
MSQVIDLCQDSCDDDGERPNTAPVPSLLFSVKRPRDNENSSNGAHPRNENGPGNKTATGSAKFAVDQERADEVEVVSPHKKRRGIRPLSAAAPSPMIAMSDLTQMTVAELHAHKRDLKQQLKQ